MEILCKTNKIHWPLTWDRHSKPQFKRSSSPMSEYVEETKQNDRDKKKLTMLTVSTVLVHLIFHTVNFFEKP